MRDAVSGHLQGLRRARATVTPPLEPVPGSGSSGSTTAGDAEFRSLTEGAANSRPATAPSATFADNTGSADSG